MKNLFYTLILFAILASCAGSPLATDHENNSNTFVAVMQQPDSDDLIGTWEVEQLSYDLIAEKGYFNNYVQLVIEDNEQFTYTSLPDMVWDPTGLPTDTTLRSGYGKWMLNSAGQQWLVTLDSDTEKEVTVLMYYDNGELILYMPVGNLGTSKGLLFKRTKPTGIAGQ